MNVKIPFTREDFISSVGREPEDNDLDRANCTMAGELGHEDCGVCVHNKPLFTCHTCFHVPKQDVVRIMKFRFIK